MVEGNIIMGRIIIVDRKMEKGSGQFFLEVTWDPVTNFYLFLVRKMREGALQYWRAK